MHKKIKLSQEDMEEAWEHVIKNNINLIQPIEGWWMLVFSKDNGDFVEFDLSIKKDSPFVIWISGHQDLYAKEGGHYEDDKNGQVDTGDVQKDSDY